MNQPKIISDPKILSGKPVIAGTRISVELILDRIASGMTEKEILADYPHITSEQIHAAVTYAKEILPKGTKKPEQKEAAPVVLYAHEISR
jgi:uncharacterized protein (DUF433 family)